MAPGARSKFGVLMFEPEVFRKQMHCIQGRRYQVRGPIGNTLAGPRLVVCRNFEGVYQGIMIEIGDAEKARPERVAPRPPQQRLQLGAP